MQRCVIVGGADIGNYGYIREQLLDDDYVVFCDSGLKHLPHLRKEPDLIVGDFDSHENPQLDGKRMIRTRYMPSKKPFRGALMSSC